MSTIVCTVVLFASSFSNVSVPTAVDDTVDLIEVNHVYDAEGRPAFTQLIFYDWSPEDSRFQVRAWRMLKQVQHEPYRDWNSGDYEISFYDKGVMRQIRSRSVRHTWTNFDPEVAERAILPANKRRGLTVKVRPHRTKLAR